MGRLLPMRAFACAVFGTVAVLLWAQPRANPMPKAPAELTAQTAKDALAEFRASRFAAPFCLQFELAHRPRRGAETLYAGVLWGAPTDGGSAVRLVCWKKDAPSRKRQFLMCNGRGVWAGGFGEPVRALSAGEQTAPLFEGLLYAPFDVMMPFVYWNDWRYEGSRRAGGRTTDLFRFQAPADWRGAHAEVAAVRVALDRTFNALTVAESLDEKGAILRTFRILDLKKVADVWMVKSIDCVDTQTRDKDRFQVRAAAINPPLPANFFSPEALKAAPSLAPEGQWTVF